MDAISPKKVGLDPGRFHEQTSAFYDSGLQEKADAFFTRADSWIREPRLGAALRTDLDTRRAMADLKLLLTDGQKGPAEKRDALSSWIQGNKRLYQDVFSLELGSQLAGLMRGALFQAGWAHQELSRSFSTVEQAFAKA